MTNPATYRDLAERVRGLTGPSGTITREIYAALGWDEAHWLPVTESLDAALAFAKAVLPGCSWDAHHTAGETPLTTAGIFLPPNGDLYPAEAAAPALAVLAATLMAMAESEPVSNPYKLQTSISEPQ